MFSRCPYRCASVSSSSCRPASRSRRSRTPRPPNSGGNVIEKLVVVVYHVTIVAIGHGLLKKFWPLVLGCVLRTAGSSII